MQMQSKKQRNSEQIEFRDSRVHQKINRANACKGCFRPQESCFCDKISPVSNRLRVIILQHPREQYKLLNSARLTECILKNCAIYTGLSWPNFRDLAGDNAMPSRWGVLFLKGEGRTGEKPIAIFNKKDNPVENPELDGIVALDGSWREAKTLWWRNPWLLRLNRISLNPDFMSLRSQAKEIGLSTIEAVAFALENLGEPRETADLMRKLYFQLIVQGTRNKKV